MERPDDDLIARSAIAHLTAFEDARQQPAIVDALRKNFVANLKALARKEYYPRPHKFDIRVAEYHRPPQLETPIITENIALNQLMFLLFERCINLKGHVWQYYRQNSRKFNVFEDFGIRIEPFINKIGADEIRPSLTNFLPPGLDPTEDGAFMNFIDACVQTIHGKNMVGTTHRFLSKKGTKTRNVIEYRNACRNYIRTMAQRYEKNTAAGQCGSSANAELIDMRRMLISLLCACCINEYSSEALNKLSFNEVLEIYSDELALMLGARVDPVAGDAALDFEYAPRTIEYIDLGTRYGDCTSRDKEKQVGQVPNIFWTIASHVLDIFYQVQELQYENEPLLKAHLIPCFFRDEPALHIDAIETMMKIRRYKSNVKATPNPQCDMALNARRREFLALTMERVRHLADAMGIEQITCESYSNTQWVRQELDDFPPNIYHISEYRSLYDNDFLRDVAQALLGIEVEIRTEIQALNLDIMDQGLRPRYKEQKVIRGSLQNTCGALRGI